MEFSAVCAGHSISSITFGAGSGELLAVSASSGEVLQFSLESRTFSSLYTTDSTPVGMAVDRSSGDLFFTNHSEQCVMRGKSSAMSAALSLSPYLARFEGRSFVGPTSITISALDGELYFTDGGAEGDSSIINPSGAVFRTVQNRSQLVPLCPQGLQRPTGVTMSQDGCLYVCEQAANRLLRFVPRGSYYSSSVFFHFEGSLGPTAVAVASSLDLIFVALYEPTSLAGKQASGRIVVLNKRGVQLRELETPAGTQLTSLCIDPDESCLYAIHANDEQCTSTLYCFPLA